MAKRRPAPPVRATRHYPSLRGPGSFAWALPGPGVPNWSREASYLLYCIYIVKKTVANEFFLRKNCTSLCEDGGLVGVLVCWWVGRWMGWLVSG